MMPPFISRVNRTISGGHDFLSSNKTHLSAKEQRLPPDVREQMRTYLEIRFTKQFQSSNEPSIMEKDPRQIKVLAKVCEKLLFASASSIDEYADTSTLEDRFRYIVVRLLRRKLRSAA